MVYLWFRGVFYCSHTPGVGFILRRPAVRDAERISFSQDLQDSALIGMQDIESYNVIFYSFDDYGAYLQLLLLLSTIIRRI